MLLSAQCVDAAVEEVKRTKQEYGFRAVFLRPNPVCGRDWNNSLYDPLWAERQTQGMAFYCVSRHRSSIVVGKDVSNVSLRRCALENVTPPKDMDLEAASRGLEDGWSVPTDWYWRRDIFDFEMAAIFQRKWQFFRPRAMATEPGVPADPFEHL